VVPPPPRRGFVVRWRSFVTPHLVLRRDTREPHRPGPCCRRGRARQVTVIMQLGVLRRTRGLHSTCTPRHRCRSSPLSSRRGPAALWRPRSLSTAGASSDSLASWPQPDGRSRSGRFAICYSSSLDARRQLCEHAPTPTRSSQLVRPSRQRKRSQNRDVSIHVRRPTHGRRFLFVQMMSPFATPSARVASQRVRRHRAGRRCRRPRPTSLWAAVLAGARGPCVLVLFAAGSAS